VHHPYDRAARDAWRRSARDVVEGLLGRRIRPSIAGDPHLELGPLEVDGLVVDEAGTPVHVEFQTRADRALGARMARYFAALNVPRRPPPDQHVVLLHPDADFLGIGTYSHGRMHLRYEVHRMWEIDAEVLLGWPGLLRLLPLARPPASGDRAELLAIAARAIRERLAGHDADSALYWALHLANLYLSQAVIAETLEALHMPIDLSHTSLVRESRAEARRQDLRRIVVARFGDSQLADRAAILPEGLLEDAIDVTATAGSVAEITSWLDAHDAEVDPSA